MKLPLLLAAALGIGGYTLTRSLVKRPPPPPPPTLPAPSSPDKIPSQETSPASSAFKPGNNNTAARPKAPRPTLDQLLEAEPEKRLDLLIPWLPKATAPEVETLTNAWDDSLDSTEGLWEALVRRWVEVDPTAALAHARVHSLKTLAKFGNPAVTRFSVLVRSVPAYRAFLQLKPADALALLSTEPVPLLAQLLQQLSYSVEQKRREEWAAANAHLPDSKLWAATPPGAVTSKPYRGLLVISTAGEAIKMKLAKQDLSGGLADIEALPRNHERSILELHYAEALAQKSPADAVAWEKSKLGGLSQMQAIALVAKELSITDPAKALAMLKENNVRAMGETRLGAAMVSTGQGTSISYQGNWQDVLKTTLSSAAAQDPGGAMDFLV